MPLRCIQFMLPLGVAYTLVLLSVWNTLLVLGPFIFNKLQAVGHVANATVQHNHVDISSTSGLTKNFARFSEPVQFHLSKVLIPEKQNLTFKGTYHMSQTWRNFVPNSKNESVSNYISCQLNLKITDQCSSLIKGSVNSASVQKIKHQEHECTLRSLLKKCSKFTSAHGYDSKPVTSEEEDFPLAFSIKMHTAQEQAEQLLRTIYRPHNVYCIHVDRKAESGVYETMKSISRCLKNVYVIEDRETVVYMSSAAVRAELLCMRTLIASPVKWKYFINLAGQEFPLRTNLEMVMILKRLHGANDIESYDHPKFQEWRFKNKFIIKDGKLEQTNITKRPFGHRVQMSKGSAYGMFKREFVDFLLKDDVAQKLIAWLNDTSSPEENLWATLNTLPWAPGGSYVETRQTFNTHASRTLIWRWDKAKCHGRFVRSVCVFGAGDLKWLTSRPNVIANKFNNDLDPLPLQCLESWLDERVRSQHKQTVDDQYLASLPHVKYYKDIDEKQFDIIHMRDKKKKWLKKHPWLE